MSYELVYSQKLNQDYKGHAEQCSWTFTVNKPDQLGAYWTALDSLEAHIEELRNQGAIVLEYYLWEDKSPTWSTDYYCRVVSSASPLPWGLIVLGVLFLLALIVTYYIIKEVKEIAEYVGPTGATTIGLAVAGIAVVTILGMLYLMKPKLPKGKSKPKEIK